MPILFASGFDNTGGAGIIRDNLVANFLNTHSYSLITCFAVQNSTQGYGNFKVSPIIIKQSLEAIFKESEILFCKIGMVGNKTISNILAHSLKGVKIIMDTPLKTSSGFVLQTKSDILPLLKKSFLITPNKEEFDELGGFDFFFSLKTNFLIKSFNEGEDVLYKFENNKFTTRSFSLPPLQSTARGTGCALASAITCFLHEGFNLESSIEKAKALIHKGIKESKKQNNFSNFLSF